MNTGRSGRPMALEQYFSWGDFKLVVVPSAGQNVLLQVSTLVVACSWTGEVHSTVILVEKPVNGEQAVRRTQG